MSIPVNPVVAVAVIGLVLGAFLVLWVLAPALMYEHHRKARQRAGTPPDGMPQVPGREGGEAA